MKAKHIPLLNPKRSRFPFRLQVTLPPTHESLSDKTVEYGFTTEAEQFAFLAGVLESHSEWSYHITVYGRTQKAIGQNIAGRLVPVRWEYVRDWIKQPGEGVALDYGHNVPLVVSGEGSRTRYTFTVTETDKDCVSKR